MLINSTRSVETEDDKVSRSFEHWKLEVARLLSWEIPLTNARSFWTAFSEELSSLRVLTMVAKISFSGWDSERRSLFVAYLVQYSNTSRWVLHVTPCRQLDGLIRPSFRAVNRTGSSSSVTRAALDSWIDMSVGHYKCTGSRQQSSGCVSGRWQWGQSCPGQSVAPLSMVGYMWALVLGGGASSTLLPSGRTAGLVVPCPHTEWVLLLALQQFLHSQQERGSHRVHQEARRGRGHEGCLDAATQSETSSLWHQGLWHW